MRVFSPSGDNLISEFLSLSYSPFTEFWGFHSHIRDFLRVFVLFSRQGFFPLEYPCLPAAHEFLFRFPFIFVCQVVIYKLGVFSF